MVQVIFKIFKGHKVKMIENLNPQSAAEGSQLNKSLKCPAQSVSKGLSEMKCENRFSAAGL